MMANDLMIPNVDVAGIQSNALMKASDGDIAKTQANALVDIARIQADVAKTQAYAHLQIASIQADTARSLERMRLNTEETKAVISSASLAMSQTLSLYGGVGGSDFFEASVKSKVGGIFGKSCKITVKARRCNNFHYYIRRPAR